MAGFLKALFDDNAKDIKRYSKVVERINMLEDRIASYSDAELRAKTDIFREQLADGTPVEQIMPEAFAVCREASRRILNMRHFDVQLIGGLTLADGRIAEMKTGEGKTLVATAPAYLKALEGKGVHVVTVNDYLARRDSEWMGRLYNFLGLSVGLIVAQMPASERREAYNCDITYATNNELGFDYLRDNMARIPEARVQRDLYYAIVDEVDSILIDEARTPLIISGSSGKPTQMYYQMAEIVPRLKNEVDYTVDEKTRTVALTEQGSEKVESMLGLDDLYDDKNTEINHYVNQALKAHTLFRRDRDYVVKDGQVIIVDEFTGRLMFGRRYSEGLHQSIEAKERVQIERETQTLASITFQNYFRMYNKLSGMTGTAKTEEDEFRNIYGFDVVEIPTNMPMISSDFPDVIYRTQNGKYQAIVEEISQMHSTGRPVLVGTVSIEKSEIISSLLKKRGLQHNVLNAKYHEKEAEIVAQAGRKNAITIATNMAGRGTDIVLGGNYQTLAQAEVAKETAQGEKEFTPAEVLQIEDKYKKQTAAEHDEVVALGGLHIIGTERHESRRIDNQLRGRAGRQGDPGSSRFYISMED
ncbi:MAG: preprotein translocase subunit SecA, partial [Clostridia bacterium]|nr:preprotein translocase subunit SecA [Clostridia bacterium]